MIDISKRYEHYAGRLRAAMDDRRLTNEGLAERLDAHPVTVSKLRTGTIHLDDEWRARVAAALAIAEDVLFGDAPLPSPKPHEIYVSPKKALKRGAGKPLNDNIPLYGMAAAAGIAHGHMTLTEEKIEDVPCPPALRDVIGAYALKTSGDSMKPRYMPGDILYVNPRQAVRKHDHVVIATRLHDNSGTETWIKRYDGATARHIVAWQYNPPAEVKFDRRVVQHVHRVLPVNELFGSGD